MTPEHLAERYNEYLQSITLEKYITSMEGPGVGKQLTEDDLREHGFTDKEIARLREILTRQESQNKSYFDLIDELRKRLWAGVLGFFIVFIVLIHWCYNYKSINHFAYFFILLFGFSVVYKLTPFPMALKAYKLYLKIR
ncbi:TPA: hypothetical protein QHU19_003402 [Klebsiella aerogenes]|uniref:hypothetical protein n=1 Tax=Klebsiella aerogenes TaxID=548 RepID=UPI0013D11F74|nr:hypothetical protein [Klebsiella aerogenes]EKW5210482.1 hypothetical protein [Klebsiella aerogenes]ELS4538682.1 hypothetical protein [Klebsiella aerogenes]EMB4312585.1 hypothetical protein [Klebsiella aerogenes]HBZ0404986.1 hypothetical protein [Klebsiella aerogenes]HBZ0410250.1 hypothetical protein [Klebsiella aerogenes]